jgi:hypothetical protein
MGRLEMSGQFQYALDVGKVTRGIKSILRHLLLHESSCRRDD